MSGGIIINGAALRHVRGQMYDQAGEGDVTKPFRIPSGMVLAGEESCVEDVLRCARDELARQRSHLSEAGTPRQRKQIRKAIVQLTNDLNKLEHG